MLDIKFIRDHPDLVKEGIKKKGENVDVDELLKLDADLRGLLTKNEALKARRNVASEQIGKLKREGKDASAALAEDQKRLEESVSRLMMLLPNIPHPSVPVGNKPSDNQEIATWGEAPAIDFKPQTHWDLASKLGIIDFDRGARIAGAGFPVYVGPGAKLQRALINFFLDEAFSHGYRELQPPLMINSASATGTGQLPDKEDLMYAVPKDELYLVPTAEVPVTNFHRDEILSEQDLPLKYCAYTPCFRREAGSYRA